MGIKREWQAEPPQYHFLTDETTDEILFGGARGGGKSDALLVFNALRRDKYPGSSGLIIRRKFTELTKPGALIPRSHEFFSSVAHWNGETRTWTWPNRSVLAFGHCEDDAAAFDYQGTQVDDLNFDQLEQFTELQFNLIKGANRTTRTDLKPLIRSTANPGGVGHGWVKNRYIDQAPPWKVWTDGTSGKTRRFIPATVDDNPHLQAGYIRTLEDMPEPWRSAWRWGRWDIFVGQFFSEWDPEIHVCRAFDPPKEWRRFGMLDYGFASPFAYYQMAYSPAGSVYLYRELYQSRVLDSAQASMIVEACRDDPPEYIVAGKDLWDLSGKGPKGQSTAETYQQTWLRQGFRTDLRVADDNRLQGWARMREWLQPFSGPEGDQTAMFQVMQVRCPNFVRTLPGLIHDDVKPEDLDSDGEDHAADAVRYGLQSRPAPKKVPTLPMPSNLGAALMARAEQRRRKMQRIGAGLR